MTSSRPPLRVRDVADQLDVHANTVMRWVKRGIGPPAFRTATGALRFPADEFDQWLAG